MAPEYTTDSFTYHNGTLMAEASELGWPVGRYPTEMIVTSTHTGRVLRFVCYDVNDYEFQYSCPKTPVTIRVANS